MKSLFLTLLVSCVLTHYVLSSHHHGEETLHEVEADAVCHKEFKLGPDEDAYELMESGSKKTACYAKCLFEKILYGKDNKNKKAIDYDALVATYKKDYQEMVKVYSYAAKNIEKCKEIASKGKDDCEKADKFAKCDWGLLDDGHKS